jgi:type IX secretion system PorP/SprF family membrane protein
VRRFIYILCILFGVTAISYGQREQLYTQFMYNKLAYNPAYAGHYDHISFTGIVRNQWIGFPGAPKTQSLSINMPIANQKLGFGINATNNSIGISSKQTLEGAYSYRFKTGANSMLSIGLQTSLRRYTVDYTDNRLIAIDGTPLDPAISGQKLNRNVINFGGGIYFNSDNFYIGVSAPRLSEADLDFDNSLGLSTEARVYYAMTGVELDINQNWTFTPQVLFKYLDNAPWDLDVNMSFTYNDRVTAGINYRHGGDSNSLAESLDLIFGFQLNEGLLIGAAYDFTLSSLRSQTAGSIEGVVTYTLGQTKKSGREINPRYF